MNKKLPNSQFTGNNCAERNWVFLWENCKEPPFMRPVKGWKIVGWGKAPWEKPYSDAAVMFEKISPPTSEFGDAYGSEMEEGTRIWQHGKKEYVPGTKEYNESVAD